MNKIRRYEDGGTVDETDMDMPAKAMQEPPEIPAGIKDISFGESFRRAKDAGLKVFTFKGKKYNTALAAPKAKAAPEPELLGPTPTKSKGMFSKMINATRDSDRKVVDAAIRGRLAKEAEAKMKDNEYAMKRGGKVKAYATGGMVSSASKRADGCAQSGKTKGKIR